WLGGILGNESPLGPGGKSRTAPSAKARSLHHLDELRGLHVPERLLRGLVAADGAIALEGLHARGGEVREENGLLAGFGGDDRTVVAEGMAHGLSLASESSKRSTAATSSDSS